MCATEGKKRLEWGVDSIRMPFLYTIGLVGIFSGTMSALPTLSLIFKTVGIKDDLWPARKTAAYL